MLQEQKVQILEQIPLEPSSAMEHTQSIPTTATDHHYPGRGDAAEYFVPELKVKWLSIPESFQEYRESA